ncbi:hypothetical protein ABK040_012256 [Willaertia magna]
MKTKTSKEKKKFCGGIEGFIEYFKLEGHYDNKLFDLQPIFDSWLKESKDTDSKVVNNSNEKGEPQLKKQKVQQLQLSNNNKFMTLPNDMICEIFNFLELKELFLTISKLNKFYRNFVNDWVYIESKYKSENIFNFILMDSFKNLLTTPELKYHILIKPSLSINSSIDLLRKSDNVDVIKEINETKKEEKKDSDKYILCEPDIEELLNYVQTVHNNYGYQIPPVLQQLLSRTSLISGYQTYFKSTIDIYYFERVNTKEEWSQLFTKLKREENEEYDYDDDDNEDEENNKDNKEEMSKKENKILYSNIYWDNSNLFPYLMWEMKIIPFGYYDRAGHGDGGTGLFTLRTDTTDLRNYASVILIDSLELMCVAHKVSLHQFIEFLVKEIDGVAEDNWW